MYSEVSTDRECTKTLTHKTLLIKIPGTELGSVSSQHFTGIGLNKSAFRNNLLRIMNNL